MYITAHSTPEPPGNKNCIFNCVADPGTWTLTETDKYCTPGTYVQDIHKYTHYIYTLRDCELWCELYGARTLTFWPNNDCVCCTASSEIKVANAQGLLGAKVYTHPGNNMCLPTTSWCFIIIRIIYHLYYYLFQKTCPYYKTGQMEKLQIAQT